jgi:hypothetical protein
MAVVAGVVFFRVRALLSGNDVATQRSFFHDGGPAPAAFLESCRAYSSPERIAQQAQHQGEHIDRSRHGTTQAGEAVIRGNVAQASTLEAIYSGVGYQNDVPPPNMNCCTMSYLPFVIGTA